MKTLNRIKKLLALGVLGLSLSVGFEARAESKTEITKVEIRNAIVVSAARHMALNFSVDSGVVDGVVTFTGKPPVYVTLSNGANQMTVLTDKAGRFSFYFLLDGGKFNVEAWTPESAASVTATSTLTQK